MAERDTISNRRNKFVQQSLKEFYYPEELNEVLNDPTSGVLVSDSIIGLIQDNDADRAEYVHEYLSGTSIRALRQAYYELPSTKSPNEWSVPSAVAQLAVGALKSIEMPTTVERQAYIFGDKKPPVDEDLRNTILTLYEDRVIDREYAQRILLLFEQDSSDASSTAQRSARTRTREDLKKRISLSTEFTENPKSYHASKALHVLNHILKAERKSDETFSYRSMHDVQVIFARENPELKRSDVNRQITDYIAYGLQIIFKK